GPLEAVFTFGFILEVRLGSVYIIPPPYLAPVGLVDAKFTLIKDEMLVYFDILVVKDVKLAKEMRRVCLEKGDLTRELEKSKGSSDAL
nr:hypothetical protein [Tanacetum cinerariifolium]